MKLFKKLEEHRERTLHKKKFKKAKKQTKTAALLLLSSFGKTMKIEEI